MKKTRPNILLWIMMSVIMVSFGFGGYLLADNINMHRASDVKTIEIASDKYEASAKIVVNYLSYEDNEDERLSAKGFSSKTLADNISIIFKHSTEMLNVVPRGYNFSIEPVDESNVLSIIVTGKDPDKCVQTVNNIRDKAPEVFAKYYSDGECHLIGDKAREATPIVKRIEIKPEEVSKILFASVGFGIGALLYLAMIIVDFYYRKKQNKSIGI